MVACAVVRLRQEGKPGENLSPPHRVRFHDRVFLVVQAVCLFQNRIRDRNFSNIVQKRTAVNLIQFFFCRSITFQICCNQPRIISDTLGMLSCVVIFFINHPSDGRHGTYHQSLCILNRRGNFRFHRILFPLLLNPVFFKQQIGDKHQQKKGPVKHRVIKAVIPGVRIRHFFTQRTPEQNRNDNAIAHTARNAERQSDQQQKNRRRNEKPKILETVVSAEIDTVNARYQQKNRHHLDRQFHVFHIPDVKRIPHTDHTDHKAEDIDPRVLFHAVVKQIDQKHHQAEPEQHVA